jgi:hypothetical protein
MMRRFRVFLFPDSLLDKTVTLKACGRLIKGLPLDSADQNKEKMMEKSNCRLRSKQLALVFGEK